MKREREQESTRDEKCSAREPATVKKKIVRRRLTDGDKAPKRAKVDSLIRRWRLRAQGPSEGAGSSLLFPMVPWDGGGGACSSCQSALGTWDFMDAFLRPQITKLKVEGGPERMGGRARESQPSQPRREQMMGQAAGQARQGTRAGSGGDRSTYTQRPGVPRCQGCMEMTSGREDGRIITASSTSAPA